LSRPEPKIIAASDASVEVAELLAAFEMQLASVRGKRSDAIARYLSAAQGWREAGQILGGAFAEDDRGSRVKRP